MDDLRLALVQGETRWRQPAANRGYYGDLIAPLTGRVDVVVLPETFDGGASAADQAETMEGPTVAWLREQSARLGAAVTGSVALREGGALYNRLLWATPDGSVSHYDKRHLFRYAGEHQRYSAGFDRLTVVWRGWRICPLVCYDLRFPVFCRNRYDLERREGLDYDLLLFVANWPAARAGAWRTLLAARAIENLCYVAGVNRAGRDGSGLDYAGESMALDFTGAPLVEGPAGESVSETVLSAAKLAAYREHFPAHLDADRFELRPT